MPDLPLPTPFAEVSVATFPVQWRTAAGASATAPLADMASRVGGLSQSHPARQLEVPVGEAQLGRRGQRLEPRRCSGTAARAKAGLLFFGQPSQQRLPSLLRRLVLEVPLALGDRMPLGLFPRTLPVPGGGVPKRDPRGGERSLRTAQGSV